MTSTPSSESLTASRPNVTLSVRHIPVCVNGYTYPHIFSPSRSPTTLVFHTERDGNIPTGNPPPDGGAECKGYEKSRFATNVGLYLGTDAR